MQMDNLLTIKQPLPMFFDRKVNIEIMNMLSARFRCGHFSERLQ